MRKIVFSILFSISIFHSSANALLFTGDADSGSFSGSSFELRGVGWLTQARTSSPYCTVQAIREKVLITAAHCVDTMNIKDVIANFDIDSDGASDVMIPASSVVLHPDWSSSPSNWSADVALIFLDTGINEGYPNASISLATAPIPVYRIARYDTVPVGLPVIVGGYGLQGPFPHGAGNHFVDNIIDRRFAISVVSASDRNSNYLFYTFAGTVLPFPSGDYPALRGSISHGDSGGGIFASHSLSRLYNPRDPDLSIVFEKLTFDEHQLLGINSHVSDKTITNICPAFTVGGNFLPELGFESNSIGEECTSEYGGYVFLYPHLSWINNTISSNDTSGSNASILATGPKPEFTPMAPVSFEPINPSGELPEQRLEDSVPFVSDAFPFSRIASVDLDEDGYPDRWNEGSTEAEIRSSGLELDMFPTNASYAIDSDSDNLPDEWEIQYFGSLVHADGVTDFDEDGISDLSEFISETDPIAACIDIDRDGWGWDGLNSCRIGDIPLGICLDEDGDGWGWNGVESCLPCIDHDGDGWGWDGVGSCIVDPSTMVTDTTYEGVACIDSDGDGHGWQEPLGRPSLGRSCKL